MADESSKMADVVVVYAQQEYYVQAAVEPGEGFSIDLLQCQVLSLIGVLLEQQVLVTSRGEIIASPHQSLGLVALPAPPNGDRVRLFVFDAAEMIDVPSDWEEVCTRCTFGDLPVVQPAFRSLSQRGFDELLCGACASTCGTDSQPVTPLDWIQSRKSDRRFISELFVVAGEPQVPTPPGFEKLPGDLNYSASGDFVHLFVKRGGSRVVTQVQVTHRPRSESPSQPVVQASRPSKTLPVDCNSGSGSDVSVFLSFDTTSWSHPEALNTYGVTDLAVISGDQEVPVGFIKISKNLNEAAVGSRVQTLYLCYKLAPLGGFACATKHGAFGGCLFESRHVSAISAGVVVASGASPQSDAVLASLESARQRADSAFLESHYRQHEPTMRRSLQGGLDRVRTYEDPRVQAEALKRIPVEKLHERARANPSPRASYQDELVMQLTHWFKREFFSWMNQPKCASCGHDKTQMVRTEGAATLEEQAGQASRVEVYQCPRCSGFTRFPRYNDPVKLLDTRTGRCGEWANCFTLCCRAMGFEARYVLDFTDHVWTEVYSEHLKRWLHCDSCEDQLDAPLTYEVGWGKSLSYIFSFSHEEVVDTARRYTQNWDDMTSRRNDVSEAWLASTIDAMNQRLRTMISPDRLRVLDERAAVEKQELQRGRQASAAEVQGRVSGSDEWKSQRKEDGKTQDADLAAVGSFSQAGDAKPTATAAEVTQSLLKNMLLGCDRKDDCKNPFCLHKRALSCPEVSPTDRAAQALQEIATIQAKNFSTSGLASMLCPAPGDIRQLLQSYDPIVYLPLQDSEATSTSSPSLLVDISGHGHHGQSDAPRRKLFRISTSEGKETKAGGLQLLPGTRLSLPATAADELTLSWLMRVDEGATSLPQGDHTVLSVNLLTGMTFSIVKQGGAAEHYVIEARAGEVSAKSAPVIRCGLYYHCSVVLSRASHEVAVFTNAVEVVRLKDATQEWKIGGDTSPAIVFEGATVSPSGENVGSATASAVVSHVAVLDSSDDKFRDQMHQRFVCQPPLQAFDSVGTRPDKTCDVDEARVQSGFRVARVRLWGGEFFDGIQFVYEKAVAGSIQTVEGPLIGNRLAHEAARSPSVELALLPNEHVSGVSGRKGAWTDSITIETSFGRRVSCGGNGGGDFRVRLPSQRLQVRAVHFDVGDHLVDAVAFVADAPAPEADETLQQLEKILEKTDSTKQQAAIAAAKKYLDNIVATPHDLKFQKIRASNKFFASSIGTLGTTTCTEFMQWCGFGVSHDCGETFYTFQSPASDASATAAMRLHYLKAMEHKQ